jgi:hypothetical protein
MISSSWKELNKILWIESSSIGTGWIILFLFYTNFILFEITAISLQEIWQKNMKFAHIGSIHCYAAVDIPNMITVSMHKFRTLASSISCKWLVINFGRQYNAGNVNLFKCLIASKVNECTLKSICFPYLKMECQLSCICSRGGAPYALETKRIYRHEINNNVYFCISSRCWLLN